MLCYKRKDDTTFVHVRLLMGHPQMSQNTRSERSYMHACLSCVLASRERGEREAPP